MGHLYSWTGLQQADALGRQLDKRHISAALNAPFDPDSIDWAAEDAALKDLLERWMAFDIGPLKPVDFSLYGL